MTLNRRKIAMTLAVIAAVCTNWACSKSSSPNSSMTTVKPSPNVQLAANATFGNIITDSLGKTLYFFAIDANGSSGCTGACITSWPVFYEANLTLDTTSFTTSDFSSITRTDGSKQTTYKGWPLYYFANDTKAGDVNGDAVGNTWFVAKPDYSVMLANEQLVGLDGNDYTDQHVVGAGVTQYITDDYGRTLYSFSHDKFKTNVFTAADFSDNSIWPIDTVKKVLNVPSILDKTQFDTLTVFGRIQLTYKGWPLYYFGEDDGQRGNTKGVSVPSPGVWPVVNGSTTEAPM